MFNYRCAFRRDTDAGDGGVQVIGGGEMSGLQSRVSLIEPKQMARILGSDTAMMIILIEK